MAVLKFCLLAAGILILSGVVTAPRPAAAAPVPISIGQHLPVAPLGAGPSRDVLRIQAEGVTVAQVQALIDARITVLEGRIREALGVLFNPGATGAERNQARQSLILSFVRIQTLRRQIARLPRLNQRQLVRLYNFYLQTQSPAQA